MKKGIALSTIAYMLLAVATIIIILTLIGDKIFPSIKGIYCSISQGVRSVLPLPSAMKTDVPSYCQQKDKPVYIETIDLKTRQPDSIAFNIASYSLACWEKTGKLNVGRNTICYELIVKGIDGEVTKDMVKSALSPDDKILAWKLDKINGPMSIGIAYNSTSKMIEVS